MKQRILLCLAAGLMISTAGAETVNGSVMRQRFEDRDGVEVIEGHAAVSLVEEVHGRSSALAVSDPYGETVTVRLGQDVEVTGGHTFFIHGWMAPDRMSRWDANLLVQWLDTDGSVLAETELAKAFTASSGAHIWVPMEAVWMEYSTQALTPEACVKGRLLLRVRTKHSEPPAVPGKRGRLSCSETPSVKEFSRSGADLAYSPITMNLSRIGERKGLLPPVPGDHSTEGRAYLPHLRLPRSAFRHPGQAQRRRGDDVVG